MENRTWTKPYPTMLNYRVCGVSWRQPKSTQDQDNYSKGDFASFMHPTARMCAINITISTININITIIITTSTSPSPVLKSYSNDFMFWNLQWFVWICGFLGPTPFLSLQNKYQSTQAQQGHKLGVVTLLIHKLRRRACHGCLYKICEFAPVMPFFACISGCLRFHLKPMACQSLVEQPQRSQGQHSCPTC